MKWIVYQRQIPAETTTLPNGETIVTREAYLQIEKLGFTDRNKETQIAEALKYSYNGEYTIEDVPMTEEEARAQRDKLLAETDWTQVLDAPIDAETREAYRAYRQALRDIPEQDGFPESITWPELPSVTKADPDPVDTAVDTMLGGETA